MTNHTTDIEAAIQTHLTQTNTRISQINANGQHVWIKRNVPERLRRRLFKGNTSKAFEAERTAIHTLQTIGAPVPHILAEGHDFMAFSDSGQTLHEMLRRRHGTQAERVIAFEAAGKALAKLHNSGYSHGRPAVRDMCWKDGCVTFLDLERYSPRRNTAKGHRNDLIIFVYSLFSCAGEDTPEAQIACQAYRDSDEYGHWNAAALLCSRMGFLDWTTRPLQKRKGKKSWEFKAIPLTFQAFRRGLSTQSIE
ncbi:MAG: lipopolysaccharide kinase InaA family protein [Pseudoruegeria sp.]